MFFYCRFYLCVWKRYDLGPPFHFPDSRCILPDTCSSDQTLPRFYCSHCLLLLSFASFLSQTQFALTGPQVLTLGCCAPVLLFDTLKKAFRLPLWCLVYPSYPVQSPPRHRSSPPLHQLHGGFPPIELSRRSQSNRHPNFSFF